ncbi:MAG: hypothetical protein ACPGQL_08610 [Thermoplasmatota archaeon]
MVRHGTIQGHQTCLGQPETEQRQGQRHPERLVADRRRLAAAVALATRLIAAAAPGRAATATAAS